MKEWIVRCSSGGFGRWEDEGLPPGKLSHPGQGVVLTESHSQLCHDCKWLNLSVSPIWEMQD